MGSKNRIQECFQQGLRSAIYSGFILAGIHFSAYAAFASAQVGTVTLAEGDVRLFTNPRNDTSGPSPHVLFEGKYYTVRGVRVGERVEKGNILRTGVDSKARVVFDNGDQYHVAPMTAYRVNWKSDTAEGEPVVSLDYGKIRGIVTKGGPRSRLTVRTRSATMGVRGTDFFVADEGVRKPVEISVLRGSVAVKPKADENKVLQVKAGYAAEVSKPTAAAAAAMKPASTSSAPVAVQPQAEIRKITQGDLVEIHQASKIEEDAGRDKVRDKKVQAKLEQLDKKSVEATLKDIKTANPKLFAQIKKAKIESVDEINKVTVQEHLKTAPKAPSGKISREELEDLETGAYEKYFRE